MKNKKKLPAVVTTLILTLITAVFWVFFSAFRSFTKVIDIEVPAEMLTPLNPTLDQQAIDQIKSKTLLNSVPDVVAVQEQQPEEQPVEPTEQPTQSTGSGQIEVQPTSEPEASLGGSVTGQ